MSLESMYRDVVSGQAKGLLATSLRSGLGALEGPYRWTIQRRNLQFDRGHVRPHEVAAPVISVGNLTVGGTGKTPFVAWLATWFTARGTSVTILSRGYGSASGRPNDEALELAAQLPGVPHIQNRDRVAASCQALAANPRQVLILDDGFQHRRLARDLDIVLLDALAPFGYERLLPRGLLREPITGLSRAHVIALSRSDAVGAVRRDEIRQTANCYAPQALWLELRHQPRRFITSDKQEIPLAELTGQPVAAFCGIGNPSGFRHALTSAGVQVASWRELPDHCSYSPRIVRSLEQWLASVSAEHVICTRKDLVKIPRSGLGGKRLWALEIGLEIVRGLEELAPLLQKYAELSSRGAR